MESATKYGQYYWCVQTNLSKTGEIHLCADRVEVTQRGGLLFWTGGDLQAVTFAVAPGNWRAYFLASPIDGDAVSVAHWTDNSDTFGNSDGLDSDPVSPEDRILRIIERKGPLTIREITQQTKTVDSKNAKQIIAGMVTAGQLVEAESGRTYRYALPE